MGSAAVDTATAHAADTRRTARLYNADVPLVAGTDEGGV
jgi:hypothetical protein